MNAYFEGAMPTYNKLFSNTKFHGQTRGFEFQNVPIWGVIIHTFGWMGKRKLDRITCKASSKRSLSATIAMYCSSPSKDMVLCRRMATPFRSVELESVRLGSCCIIWALTSNITPVFQCWCPLKINFLGARGNTPHSHRNTPHSHQNTPQSKTPKNDIIPKKTHNFVFFWCFEVPNVILGIRVQLQWNSFSQHNLVASSWLKFRRQTTAPFRRNSNVIARPCINYTVFHHRVLPHVLIGQAIKKSLERRHRINLGITKRFPKKASSRKSKHFILSWPPDLKRTSYLFIRAFWAKRGTWKSGETKQNPRNWSYLWSVLEEGPSQRKNPGCKARCVIPQFQKVGNIKGSDYLFTSPEK